MGPFRVTVRRGAVVESVHLVHAVSVQGGRIIDSVGDPDLLTFYRSAAKPIQALPLARERPDVTEAELAIACASHRAGPAQLEAASSLLAKAPATEGDLECGPQEERGPSRLAHNCSGKHAGFLAVCRARGWPIEGYRLADHPMQQLALHEVAAAADILPDAPSSAVDGCGVVTFALTLERMAHSFSRLAQLDGGERIAAAMAARPELVGGEHAAVDTELMRARPGWVAKGGAEGVLCIASPEGIGVALKVEDGASRARWPAVAKFVGLPEEWGRQPVENSRGDTVGEVALA